MRLLFSIILLAVIFNGCVVQPQVAQHKDSSYEKPEWVTGLSGGVVGMCGTHMKGNAAQEQLAIDRALAKLAKQETVSVHTSSISSQKEVGGRYSSGFGSNTSIDANTKVKGHIKASWRDPRTNTYYVWMEKE